MSVNRIFLVAAFASVYAVAGAHAQSPIDNKPKVHASLIAERDGVAPGGEVTVALREVIRKNWHTYWKNPGDSGEPTRITWTLPPGWKAGEIQWPYPERLPVGPLMDFGYSDEVVLLVPLTAPADAKPGERARIVADAMWLVCEEVCIPEETQLSLDLKIESAQPPPNPEWTGFFARARSFLPQPSPWHATYSADNDRFMLSIESEDLAQARPREAFFFPAEDGAISNPAPQRLSVTNSGITLSTKAGWKLSTPQSRATAGAVSGVVVMTGVDGRKDAIELTARPGPALAGGTEIGLGIAILFAFFGGLILNLMPCVLPVLSIKALAFAGKGGAKSAHREALAYGAGVVLTFAVLAAFIIALRAGGEIIGWGFQLQEPMVVAGFALLMFAVGLNLSGVFEIGAAISNFGEHLVRHGGAVGSFFTGMLAVAVAAPCTAPFMGAAMGFALTQPAGISLAVFIALSLGFAAPFVALGFSPGLIRLLPKPGAWMETLRQFLAFPMYATAIWLAWVLSLEAGLNALTALLAAALAMGFAFWAFGVAQKRQGRARMMGFAAALAGLLAAAALLPEAGEGKPAEAGQAGLIPSEPYSAAKLADFRAEGRPVFVNATAAWCITCLVNERVALQQQAVADIFRRNNVAYLLADWTNRNPEVTQLLTRYGRSGVPLYLYFPPRGDAVVLPQILTESIIRSTLEGGQGEENTP
ncbi:MAG: protein-disulfide reductase DsbD family protein [Alphaproteobacteria bacterium]